MEKTYSLDSLLGEFAFYEINVKKRNEDTVKFYIGDIKILVPDEIHEEFLKELKEKCRKIIDKEYYDGLVEKFDERISSRAQQNKDKLSTIARRTSALNTFNTFLEKTGRIEKAIYYPCVRVERAPLVPLTQKEFENLMKVIPYDNYRNARDRAIFSLMFYTGLKESEVVELKDQNFKFENGKLYLNVGWGCYKRRKLENPEQVAKEISNYEKLYSAVIKSENFPSLEKDSFFKNKFGKKISTRSIRRKFEKWTKIAKVEADLKSLGYSYAKTQLDKGIKPEELAELMGITKRYCQVLVTFIESSKKLL